MVLIECFNNTVFMKISILSKHFSEFLPSSQLDPVSHADCYVWDIGKLCIQVKKKLCLNYWFKKLVFQNTFNLSTKEISYKPELVLKPEYPVMCLAYNPKDPNSIVAGLTNGQVILWDTKGSKFVL